MKKRVEDAKKSLAILPPPSDQKQKAIEAGQSQVTDAVAQGFKDYKPPVVASTFKATARLFVSTQSSVRNTLADDGNPGL